MFLKALELQGFKSFPDKTTIRFDGGMTAVVGPNGSGKSNISDAMRWVMGEQSLRALRGGKMEDVIFGGTAQRKPMGFASVSLSFDNKDRKVAVDHDEVTITRRYDRAGDSKYYINGKEVRLRDVNELLMDTGLGRDGYAMVGQGRIAEIVSAKSKERREIFEEAAGISKYRYRKAEAERRLAAAQDNLLRLYDILSELEGRIGPLKTQSEKAKVFLELAARRKTLEISLWLKNLDRYRDELKEQERLLLIAQGDEERLQRKSDEIDEKINDSFAQRNECSAKIDEARQIRENLQKRISELKAEFAVKENDIRHNDEDKEKLSDDLARFEAGEEALQKEAEECKAAILALEEAMKALLCEQQAAEDELSALLNESGEADTGYRQLQDELNQLNLDLSRSELSVMTLSGQLEDQRLSREAGEQEAKNTEQKLAAANEEKAEVEGLLKEIAEKKVSLQNTIKGYEMRLSSRLEKVREQTALLQKLDLQIKEKEQRAKLLQDMEQNLEGFSGSVKAVMRYAANNQLKGIIGTVASVISVSEEYALAIETALGAGLQNIVVADEAAAKAAIRRLQNDKAGRATFLPLTSVKGSKLEQKGLDDYAGFVGLASELVSCDDRYRDVINSLLGRIVIADDLDTASLIAKKYGYRFRIVTLDGQQVNAGGSYTGGSTIRNTGILSRKNETEKLINDALKLREKYKAQSEETERLRRDAASQEAYVNGAKAELSSANEDEIRFTGNLEYLTSTVKSYEGRIAAFKEKDADFKKREEKLLSELASLKESALLLQQQKADVSEKLAAAEELRRQALEKREDQAKRIGDIALRKIALEKDLEQQNSRLESALGSKENAKEEQQALILRMEELEARNRELQLSLARMEEDEISFREQIENYEKRIGELTEKRMQLEQSELALREEQRSCLAEKEKVTSGKVRLEEQKILKQKEYDGIIERLWEDYELTRSEAMAFTEEIEDTAAANKELNHLRQKIKALGHVNLAAVEEYREVSARYEELSEQVRDASGAKAELERLIEELTHDMRRIFSEQFKKINENFSEIFVELFDGGSARLLLTDPGDVLESGIEIQVQPPGKIIKNLSSLSGGEQSFVAIAIYLAILKVRPAPFCVLDEIEAALDDVNVAKYARYLRRLCNKTQFILITHRRGTMEEADTLYGVTMQEQGVSKLLRLLNSQQSEDLVNG